MKQYTAQNIRNIVLGGHGGSGKTSLAEAMLYLAGASERLGKVADGNTVMDFDPEEMKRKTSVSTAVAPLEWKDCKINLIDTPGLFDFAGGLCEGVRAGDCVIIPVSGKSGAKVGAEKAFQAASKRGIGKIFFVTKLDEEHADFAKAIASIQEVFGAGACPVVIPYMEGGKAQCYIDVLREKAYTYDKGKMKEVPMPQTDEVEEIRMTLSEAVAETDEDLMEKYFAGESFTNEEFIKGVQLGLKSGDISPILCGSGLKLDGVAQLLDCIVDLVPSAADAAGEVAETMDGEPVELKVSEDDPTAAIVFKTVADPFVGKLSYFKVISGKVKADTQMFNSRTGQPEKVGKLLTIRGKKQEDTTCVVAGDIGAVVKLASAKTGDTLSSTSRPVKLEGVNFPTPSLSMAVKPKNKGDEEKMASGLSRLKEEDPTITVKNNVETHQMVLSGLGEQHLDVIASKLKQKFGVELKMKAPKVAYRETIRKKVKVQGRHKKQTGGHGQFGDVWIEFEPCDGDDLVFEEKVFGGAVPKNFFPAVEKGLRDCVEHGVLAGYPVVGLKATLVDGSYHPVDSSEMSFKMAAGLAYKAGLPQASPVLLEPIGSVKVFIPEANMGDIIGEVNKRRGRVLGMDAGEDGMQVVSAEAPEAEMYDFSTYLRQVTQGRGSFTMSFERYEEAPSFVAQKVIDAAKAAKAAKEAKSSKDEDDE
ncbi:elongation factor G [Solibaculum mannosilyticum]|uniref:Elongation factor G n=1 Tax=Solibaculum mannosilyticum TaxID=2780922 RepID=A0A7I8D4F5_9FIRM|nr:elongation factor G [Solibaculum mannosilyticum]MCO7137151.1 elongation factor G [[Clostridium] leptum]BCI59504.1 elongation factor G [Solibaculum mannosilyticum]CZT55285.1 Elongation factor G [Eubacteriaceae bacterium CHKCI005]